MKKIILTILAMLFATSVVSAKSFGSEGYKGDVSFSYGFGISNTVDNFSFSTTHGYQFTPGFFLGFGGELSVFRDCTFIPVYVATKYFLFSEGRRVAPVLGCRFGYGIFAAADDPDADRLCNLKVK